ncbi:MAG: Hsp70 family protein [Thermodesulfobacteriota bacterium]
MNIAFMTETIKSLQGSSDRYAIRDVIGELSRDYTRGVETLGVFELAFELVTPLADPAERLELLTSLLTGMPCTGPFKTLYATYMDVSIATADVLPAHHHRTTELLRLARALPATDEFLKTRVWAWRLALGLPDRPRFEEPRLEKLAKELPKSKDYTFYKGYTLLGIAAQLPTTPPFTEIYREAITLAIDACAVADEPYYKKYALISIAKEIEGKSELEDIYVLCFENAFKASMEVKDDFAREHALVDLLQEIPVRPLFYGLLKEVLEKSLTFFTMRRRMDDMEITDVVDFVLSAEDLYLKDSKKRKFDREKYAKRLAGVLHERGKDIKDTRFLEVLRPYAHVWIRPAVLREAAREVITSIESLKKTFHGREIKRPVLIGGESRAAEMPEAAGSRSAAYSGCVAIDLGATNTLVMRRKEGQPPEFIPMDPLTINYGNATIVPTIISRETDTIGAAVIDEDPVVNLKQMALEGKDEARVHLERFLKILYTHIEGSMVKPGWFKLFSSRRGDVLYITVPIGFNIYKDILKEIAGKVFKGQNVEFVEEPLAAAVGYQVAGEEDSVIMMIDFGGCTLDCMILRLSVSGVHVIAKPERAQIMGGHDIDRWIADYLASRAKITGEPGRPLLLLAEKLKIALSEHESVPFEWEGKKITDLTRYDLEEALDAHDFYHVVDRTIGYVLRRAAKVGLQKRSISAVILTGGSSQIPSFKDKVCEIFSELRARNLVFDHSPLTAVAEGAAQYGTRDVVDRHLAMAYAVRYATGSEEHPFSYTIVMEKGESLPVTRTFSIIPARRLGEQKEIFLEIFEVPEALVVRRWVEEGGVELLKQKIVDTRELFLNVLKSFSLPLPLGETDNLTLSLIVEENGALSVKWGGSEESIPTGIRLQ